MTSPFDEKKAAAQLGHPGETFDDVLPYQLPEVYWPRIGSGATALGGPYIVRDGALVTTKGYATASAWLRRAVMPLAVALDASAVAQVLEFYEALPLGWGAQLIYADDPATGEHGGIRQHPFELRLVAQGTIHPRSRDPNRTLPPESAPPAGPAGGGPPGAGGVPRGYAPPQACRAILKEVDGTLTWIVEQHQQPLGEHGSWALLLTEPIE